MGTWGVSDILYVYETIAASPASIYSAIAQPAQLPDMSLRRDTQALHLIARIPLIQRREKSPSREEKSAFTQWNFLIYVRSLMYVVLKTRYVNPNIHVRRYQIHVRSPNLFATRS